MAARCPGVRGAAWDELVAKVLRRDPAVPDRALELGRHLIVEPGRLLERLVAQAGNSFGHGTGTSSPNRAYATRGSDVSSSTPAPYASATSFTG